MTTISRIAPDRFPGKLGQVQTGTQTYPEQRSDGPLWMAALGLSLLLNALILALVGFAALRSVVLQKPLEPSPPVEERVATIFAEMSPPANETAAAMTPAKQRFARTSDDQLAEPVENPAFMGERNTRATSDRAPDDTAPPLPSQAGIEPRDADDIETTESRYQDGMLAGADKPAPTTEESPSPPAPETPPTTESTAARPAESESQAPLPTTSAQSPPPPREKLLEGPNPVDTPVPRETAAAENPKPTPEPRPDPAESPQPPKDAPPVAEAPKPRPTAEPAFKGYQRKTAVIGSITRSGRSALDVEDTPMGRYQAAISRAVEQEWQRNCVRHRDFITPGFLTVRFFVEPSGKVRSVQFVGDMETGEVQKGFTLNSIRDAGIPAMPPALRKEHEKEPLELIFRFYF